MDSHRLTLDIKSYAHQLGFSGIAIAKAEKMDVEARRLEEWLNGNNHGEMHYMADHFDMRIDPCALVPGAKSVVSLMYNYYTETPLEKDDSPKISMYAYGEDYHKVIRKKLKALLQHMKSMVGDIDGRVFVDSAPVLERDWARRSGLGWVGKNTLLIHPKKGSYFFLAEIICDVVLEYDIPMQDYCGTCRRCIDACPTDAISPSGYLMDGSKCISYLTIELKSAIPDVFEGKMDNWMYGCDICQQVCPWNRFSTPHHENAFLPSESLQQMNQSLWLSLTEEMFEGLFKHSAIKRTKYSGLKRNIRFLNVSDI